ncbi:MAG: DUF1579 family protein [Candidatus Korobacteraceae bacterium]
MRSVSAAFSLGLLASAFAVAQVAQQPQTAPAPSPQVQMMNYFAGDWKLTGTTKISPSTPGAPFTSTEHGEWVPGGFFLEIHSVMKGPLGDVHGVRMMEYNAADKVYTYNAYNSLGEHQVAIGKAQGNTWTWNAEEKMNGVTTNGHYIATLLTPDSYTFRSQVQKPGGGWVTVMEGTATRSSQ